MTGIEKQGFTLHGLQSLQEVHNRIYHQDIYHLSSPDKLKHFALHLAKYITELLIKERNIKIVLADTMIITTSILHLLRVDIDNEIMADLNGYADIGFEKSLTIDELCKLSISNIALPYRNHNLAVDDIDDFKSRAFLERYADFTRPLFRYCEGMDHLDTDYTTDELRNSMLNLIRLCMLRAGILKIDLAYEIQKRWTDIEQKQIK